MWEFLVDDPLPEIPPTRPVPHTLTSPTGSHQCLRPLLNTVANPANFKGNPTCNMMLGLFLGRLNAGESVKKTLQLLSWSCDFGVFCLRRGQVHGRGRSITYVGDTVRS